MGFQSVPNFVQSLQHKPKTFRIRISMYSFQFSLLGVWWIIIHSFISIYLYCDVITMDLCGRIQAEHTIQSCESSLYGFLLHLNVIHGALRKPTSCTQVFDLEKFCHFLCFTDNKMFPILFFFHCLQCFVKFEYQGLEFLQYVNTESSLTLSRRINHSTWNFNSSLLFNSE